MLTIWKFELPQRAGLDTVVSMPKGADCFTAQMNAARICVWAFVDETEPIKYEDRFISVIATGTPAHKLGSGHLRHLGTVQETLRGTIYVWHVFEHTPVIVETKGQDTKAEVVYEEIPIVAEGNDLRAGTNQMVVGATPEIPDFDDDESTDAGSETKE